MGKKEKRKSPRKIFQIGAANWVRCPGPGPAGGRAVFDFESFAFRDYLSIPAFVMGIPINGTQSNGVMGPVIQYNGHRVMAGFDIRR